ncbi:MAG: Uncharacterised protein [Cryomorphaceae bacterium]|nr:MAG: Uncharacterised protein [Cryomorphaceae bacterium]
MYVTTVVVDPPDGLVTVENIRLFVATIVLFVDIVCRVIYKVVVNTITIAVLERSQLVWKFTIYTVTWPFLDAFRDLTFVTWEKLSVVTVWVFQTLEPRFVHVHFFAEYDPVTVVLITNFFVRRSSTVCGQWTWPVIVTCLTVGHGCQFQLVTFIYPTEPK